MFLSRRKFEVVSDVANGSWKVRSNGTTLRRTNTKDAAVMEAALRARNSDSAILEIRRANGQFQEYRSYNNA